MKYVLIVLLLVIAGCATLKTSAESLSVDIQFNPDDPNQYTIVVDANDVRIDLATLGKDVNVGKGFMSTVSPKNTGIIEAIGGFCLGIFVR